MHLNVVSSEKNSTWTSEFINSFRIQNVLSLGTLAKNSFWYSLLIFIKECWRALRAMEHWRIGSSCAAWTWPGKMGPVLGKMELPGCLSYISITKRSILVSKIFSWKCPKQVGLKGEAMNLNSPNGISAVDWMQGSLIAQKQQPLTWHKVILVNILTNPSCL